MSPSQIHFKDYPNFKPNLTPRQMFNMGSFGGTYWRPIYSDITKKKLKNVHKKYGKLFKGIPDEKLSQAKYDKNINKYGVKVGTTLEFWEDKGWITKKDPYGWVEWYCNFYNGRRIPSEDVRQIKRWSRLTGENGRFRKWLVTLIIKNNSTWNDENISPKIRQTLQHWGYKLTSKDYNVELKIRNNKIIK
jgi:hypothetical protein